MTSPLQNSASMARIQPAKLKLPTLARMRADLLKIENDNDQPPIVRLLAGSQRTIVDHLWIMDHKFQGLVVEINAALSPPAEETAEAQNEPVLVPEVVPEPVSPAAPAPAQPQAATDAPQMTITPVKKQPKTKGGAQ